MKLCKKKKKQKRKKKKTTSNNKKPDSKTSNTLKNDNTTKQKQKTKKQPNNQTTKQPNSLCYNPSQMITSRQNYLVHVTNSISNKKATGCKLKPATHMFMNAAQATRTLSSQPPTAPLSVTARAKTIDQNAPRGQAAVTPSNRSSRLHYSSYAFGSRK